MATKKLLSIGQVADMLGVSASSVRLLCDSGKLAFVRPLGPNGHRKVRPEALESYLDALESPANQQGFNVVRDEYQPIQRLADTIADIKKACR